MPNWVTNRITASEQVIRAMMNGEGEIDFSQISPFPGPHHGWSGINCGAEMGANILCGIPVSDHPLIAALEKSNRENFDIRSLSDECLQQLFGMVENYRACGYLHSMDFNRNVWGTKWNACDPTADPEAGTASFDTAWSCPERLLIELSQRFPETPIEVVFADEDIGSNCGKFTLKNGEKVAVEVAGRWDSMTEDEQKLWSDFAYKVKGWEPDPEDED